MRHLSTAALPFASSVLYVRDSFCTILGATAARVSDAARHNGLEDMYVRRSSG